MLFTTYFAHTTWQTLGYTNNTHTQFTMQSHICLELNCGYKHTQNTTTSLYNPIIQEVFYMPTTTKQNTGSQMLFDRCVSPQVCTPPLKSSENTQRAFLQQERSEAGEWYARS